MQYQEDTVHCDKSCRNVFSQALAYTENVWIAAVTVAVATIDWRASPAPGESFVIDRLPSGQAEAPAVITSWAAFFAHVTVKLLLWTMRFVFPASQRYHLSILGEIVVQDSVVLKHLTPSTFEPWKGAVSTEVLT